MKHEGSGKLASQSVYFLSLHRAASHQVALTYLTIVGRQGKSPKGQSAADKSIRNASTVGPSYQTAFPKGKPGNLKMADVGRHPAMTGHHRPYPRLEHMSHYVRFF